MSRPTTSRTFSSGSPRRTHQFVTSPGFGGSVKSIRNSLSSQGLGTVREIRTGESPFRKINPPRPPAAPPLPPASADTMSPAGSARSFASFKRGFTTSSTKGDISTPTTPIRPIPSPRKKPQASRLVLSPAQSVLSTITQTSGPQRSPPTSPSSRNRRSPDRSHRGRRENTQDLTIEDLDSFEQSLQSFRFASKHHQPDDLLNPQYLTSSGRTRVETGPPLVIHTLFELQFMQETKLLKAIRQLMLPCIRKTYDEKAAKDSTLTQTKFYEMWDELISPEDSDRKEQVRLFKLFDKNRNNTVSRRNFFFVFAILLGLDDKALLRFCYKRFEHVEHGFVTKLEVDSIVNAYHNQAMQKLGAVFPNLLEKAVLVSELRDMVKRLPWSAGGRIPLPQFHALVGGTPLLKRAFWDSINVRYEELFAEQ
eukprot:TRINITY_DN104331_c0_g1_i1.p1 TRINITY_DN104331_c0_g1~~TRINITY_DN104331_c0_g1_i1.p1  ORF type:complete len:423 (+),score=13.27 TRINITY_DN104331_c0_g1_i1:43-1311(+)